MSCPTGDYPQGSRHRCEECRGAHAKARKAVKQARYRQKKKEALDRLGEVEQRCQEVDAELWRAIRTLDNTQEVSDRRTAEAIVELASLGEARGAAVVALESRLRVLEETVNGVIFRLSRLELIAQQPWRGGGGTGSGSSCRPAFRAETAGRPATKSG